MMIYFHTSKVFTNNENFYDNRLILQFFSYLIHKNSTKQLLTSLHVGHVIFFKYLTQNEQVYPAARPSSTCTSNFASSRFVDM